MSVDNNQKVIFQMAESFVTVELDYAVESFKKAPTAENWHALLRAMLVYQQQRSGSEDRAELVKKLSITVIRDWPDVIVEHHTDKTIDSILAGN